MVVTHSFRRVLMSVRSQAPANAGAGRGVNVVRPSASGFEVDVEGPFSTWERSTQANLYKPVEGNRGSRPWLQRATGSPC